MNTNSILIAAAMMLATVQNQDHFDTGHKARYQPQPQTRKDLPKFKVGDQIIHAKNIKTVLKYAKKRGLYKPGIEIIPLDQP